MANKRKAQEAFGKAKARRKEEALFSSDGVSKPQLSAFAAARQAAQPQEDIEETPEDEQDLVTVVASAPYDGYHSENATPGASLETEETLQTPLPVRPSIRLSTFVRRKENVLRDDQEHLELSLKSDESVTFVGEYDLKVLKGVVTIYGTMLHPERGIQRVYAPSTSALPAITARKEGSKIRISSVRSGLGKLESLSPLFRSIGAKDDTHQRSFALLLSSNDDVLQRSISPLEIVEETKRVLSRLNARLESSTRQARIMAVGPKSSGKSTFNRLLCNMIISRPGISQRCLYLDLDPGQPEFGPPGQLSLVEVTTPILGPSFTHPASTESTMFRSIKAHTIAAISFKDDPDHYLACAADLLKHAPKDVPMVVNSCGWVSGLGADVVLELCKMIATTDIVILDPIESTLTTTLSNITPNIHRIPRRQRQTSSRSPADLRAMQTLSYFHKHPTSATPKWSSKPLSTLHPYEVSYRAAPTNLKAILSYHQTPNPTFLSEVLTGSLVAIVILTDPTTLDPSTTARTPFEGLPYLPASSSGHSPPLPPSKSHFLSLALIRSIDPSAQTLHLLTPLSESTITSLEHQTVILVRGNFDPPEWAYLEDLYAGGGEIEEGKERPWVSKQEQQVGIEGSVWRLRHPPLARDVRER